MVLLTLLITLLVTPARRVTGWNEIIRVRRQVGLTTFWYALLHFLTYVVFASFLLLVPLAITSTQGWVRRLGGKRWRRLHRLVYLVPVGGVLHYLWLVKKDVRAPFYFAVVLAAILAARVWLAQTPRPGPKTSTFLPTGEDVA